MVTKYEDNANLRNIKMEFGEKNRIFAQEA
jgi:hypothetical protein